MRNKTSIAVLGICMSNSAFPLEHSSDTMLLKPLIDRVTSNKLIDSDSVFLIEILLNTT